MRSRIVTWFLNLRPIRPWPFEKFLEVIQKEGCTKVTAIAVAIQGRHYIERCGEYRTTTPSGRKIMCCVDYESGAPDKAYSEFWQDINQRMSVDAVQRRMVRILQALPDVTLGCQSRFERK